MKRKGLKCTGESDIVSECTFLKIPAGGGGHIYCIMKLLICDDDISTIDVIQDHLDLSRVRITKLLRAYNGEAAMEIIRKERPEIILCDIGMPRVDGIAVLRYLREELKDDRTQFAFITCYESFDYAKEAIRYGAAEYLTKPLNLDLLNELLERMAGILERKGRRAGSLNQRISDLNLNNLFLRVSEPNAQLGQDQVRILLQEENLDLSYDSTWSELYIIGDITEVRQKSWSPEDLQFTFGRLAEEVFCEYIGSAYTLTSVSERYIYCRAYIPSALSAEDIMRDKWLQFLSLCRSHFPIVPTALLSKDLVFWRIGQGIEERRNLTYSIRFRAGELVMENQARENAKIQDYSCLNEDRLLRCVREKDESGFLGEVSGFLAALQERKNLNDESMGVLRSSLIRMLGVFAENNHVTYSDFILGNEVNGLYSKALRSAADMILFARESFRLTMEAVQEVQQQDNIVDTVKKYLDKHYREEINRDELANSVYITPNYLSKRFCQETGMNMREYINRLRIEEAKKVLLTTGKSISDVAMEVGYDNISYFSTVFKRFTGVTPLSFRQGEENA